MILTFAVGKVGYAGIQKLLFYFLKNHLAAPGVQ